MRFMFRKKRYKHKKSIDDLKKMYDKGLAYRYAVVLSSDNTPLWCCEDYQCALDDAYDELMRNFRECHIVDLAYL